MLSWAKASFVALCLCHVSYWCIGKLYNLQPVDIMHLSLLVKQIITIDQEHLHL